MEVRTIHGHKSQQKKFTFLKKKKIKTSFPLNIFPLRLISILYKALLIFGLCENSKTQLGRFKSRLWIKRLHCSQGIHKIYLWIFSHFFPFTCPGPHPSPTPEKQSSFHSAMQMLRASNWGLDGRKENFLWNIYSKIEKA